jgi:Tol biopolymer transport system component
MALPRIVLSGVLVALVLLVQVPAAKTLDAALFSPTGAPTWSPDGRTLAIEGIRASDPVLAKSSELYLVPATGGDPRRLTRPAQGVFTISPSWQPHGDSLAFYQARGAYSSTRSLVVIRRDGGPQKVFVSRREGLSFNWSPSGTRLAYEYDDGGLYFLRSDGTRRVQVAGDVEKDSTFSWSPDSSRVAFVYPGGGIGVAKESGRAKRITAVGTDPRWSPDGKSIAYNDDTRIELVPSAGGKPRTLADAGDHIFEMSWSPDGRWLSYLLVPGTLDKAILRVINVRSGRTSTIAGGVLTWDWRVGSRTVAYALSRSLVRSEIWTSNPDGTAKRKIGSGSVPHWSPRGQKLAFLVPRVSGASLCVVALTGNKRVCPVK